MSDCLTITKIINNGNRIDYEYEAEGQWKELLDLRKNLFVEYNVNIEDVPNSVAVIPLLCNILPISWIFNLSIKTDNLDKEFYNCIPDIKKGYSEMYPSIKMLGDLKVSNIEENHYEPIKSATLFSGGVDAFNTLFSHIEEKPDLTTIWGADIKLSDEQGWNNVSKHHEKVANQYGLEYSFIKSNLRTFLSYYTLCDYTTKKIKGEWWHDFQHGIGILGLVSPIAYAKKYKTLYIASSFTEDLKGKYTCASDPTIDNYVKFCECKVIHDGYEYGRQDKIKRICDFMENKKEKNILLRVCWMSTGGENCCHCEKCYRTILGILAEKKDPCNFGFDFTKEKRAEMMRRLPKFVKYDSNHYEMIQKRFLKNYDLDNTPKDLIWFRKIKIKECKPNYLIIYNKIVEKVKRVIEKIFRK